MDNELLKAISDMLDMKLDAKLDVKLQPIIDTQNSMLETQNQIIQKQNVMEQKQNVMERKLDAVINQTADLTEFKINTINTLSHIVETVDRIQKDLLAVEMVTNKNWNEITTLKAVK